MSVTFTSFPVAMPDHVGLPGTTTIQFGVRSTKASEPTRVAYDLDPNGGVTFAGGGLHHATNTTATSGGVAVADLISLAGNAPHGTLVSMVVTVTGTSGPSDVAPAFVTIL